MTLYIVKWKAKGRITLQRDCESEEEAGEIIDILREEGNWSAYVVIFKDEMVRSRNIRISEGFTSA